MNLFKSALIALLGLIITCTSSAKTERIVATVNGVPILESQVQKMLGKKPMNEANRKAAIDSIIDDILVQQAVQQSGVNITNAQVEQAIESIAAQNNITYGQLLDALEYEGINIDQYRQQIAQQMMMQAVRQVSLQRNIKVTREQVEALGNQMYDDAKAKGQLKNVTATEYEVRHILLKLNPLLNDKQAQAELSRIRNSIIAGKTTFAEAAKKYSKDYLSGANGGSLGYALPDIYEPQFKSMIERTKKGVISQPFKSKFGWHILEVTGTRQGNVTQAAYRQKAYEQLVNKQLQEESNNWIVGLRRSANIQYMK